MGSRGKKVAWIRWENLCQIKEEEGLNIRDIEMFNEALLARWKWRLEVEDKLLWKNILEYKYRHGGILIPAVEVKMNHGSGEMQGKHARIN